MLKKYNVNNLSKRDALEITRDMWQWLSENPGKKKHDWVIQFRPELKWRLKANCACCQFVKTIAKDYFEIRSCSTGNCHTKLCPLFSFWPGGCCNDDSPFKKWEFDCNDSKAALLIAQAAELELLKLNEEESKTEEQDKIDPLAEIKAAHKAGKTIQYKIEFIFCIQLQQSQS